MALYFLSFLQILSMNYLGKMCGYPKFSFSISIALVKIYISRIIINRGKITFELVGTGLKGDFSGFVTFSVDSIYSHVGIEGSR